MMLEREKIIAIENFADLKALTVVNAFLLQSLLEMIGVKPEPLILAVEKMNMGLGDLFENELRKKCGLEPRTETRQSVREVLDQMSVDWSKMAEN
ncbi:MAG TPA: hypothetical protein PLN05_17370 [Pyrinomonadaceae bacterium]|nr:hypothetical protein [Pyrinomonadaceae bacterium]